MSPVCRIFFSYTEFFVHLIFFLQFQYFFKIIYFSAHSYINDPNVSGKIVGWLVGAPDGKILGLEKIQNNKKIQNKSENGEN